MGKGILRFTPEHAEFNETVGYKQQGGRKAHLLVIGLQKINWSQVVVNNIWQCTTLFQKTVFSWVLNKKYRQVGANEGGGEETTSSLLGTPLHLPSKPTETY